MPFAAHPTVSVVIVSYNTHTLLRAALQSVADCGLPVAAVVVDNASHDGSADLVAHEFPAAALIRNAANRGFAAATNQGLALAEESGAPYVLLLNPDAQLLSGALETLVEFLEQHPRVGCVGPRLLFPDGRFQEAAWRFPTLLMTLFDLFPPRGPLIGRLTTSPLNGRYRAERGGAPFPIDHPLGAAMLIRATTLRAVGRLDEGYWLYVEEVDWCRRARLAGWAIWQVPAAQVIHVGGASAQQFRGRSFVALQRSRLRFWAKFEPPATVRAQRGLLRLGMVWATLQTWRAWRRGAISRDELQRRLIAYGIVARL